ncbi:MAG TPA: MmcQ/YjbR family DNA-binding protein [Vicinamibacteria bacterium]|nr:MmcQ/YjbR family DNA-binding protein [Vicinamibacteria bacterium]
MKGKLLAWERPLRRADLEALGDRAPKGAILGVFVPDLDTKELLVANRGAIYFTTPHFDGYSVVLVRLGKVGAGELKELLRQGWTARAPKKARRRSR